jgi:transcriptional regulator of acetoin/glycerol metabolism
MSPSVSAEPKSTRLQRRLLIERAWRQYVEGGEPRGIRNDILESWRRSREAYRIDSGITRPLVSCPPDALEERRARDECLHLAAPVLLDFTQRARLRDHVLAYFDADGCLLAMDGDRRIAGRLSEIGFSPGTSWAEESAGTNGPGTALATKKAIEVFAAEHYVLAWQDWSTAAAPVRAPGGGPVAVVAMTGPWEVRRRQALTFVSAVARAIEERLRAAGGVRDEVIRYAFRAAREGGEALVAVDGQGRIIAANDAAARSNLLDDGLLPPAMREAVAKALGPPGARSTGDLRIELAEGRPMTISPVSYESSRVGAIVHVALPASGRRRSGTPDRPAARYDFTKILGNSARLHHAVELATMAARNDLPVVLTGESGTGKELFAHAIHACSGRRSMPFVAVNCGSIPPELLEAELFGYEPGTFTGARREGNPGRFEDADGGTLFLDEVTELAPPAQTALLRVLQEREVVRLGGSTPRPVDVRVVAATNRPLAEEVSAGRFRSDLYYRLNVLWITVPALRERVEDIPLLARVFLEEADVERRGLAFSADALEAMRAYRWPGNVRELRNVILRAAAVAPQLHITARDLLLGASTADAPGRGDASPPEAEASPEVERAALMTALDACAWNFRRTAGHLGISRMTLYRWVRKYGIARGCPTE